MSGNVYSSTIAVVNLYLQDDVARLTSKNSIGLTQAGFLRIFYLRTGHSNSNNAYLNAAACVSILHTSDRKLESRSAMIVATGYLSCSMKKPCPSKFNV